MLQKELLGLKYLQGLGCLELDEDWQGHPYKGKGESLVWQRGEGKQMNMYNQNNDNHTDT